MISSGNIFSDYQNQILGLQQQAQRQQMQADQQRVFSNMTEHDGREEEKKPENKLLLLLTN